jgi:hypothetical protein
MRYASTGDGDGERCGVISPRVMPAWFPTRCHPRAGDSTETLTIRQKAYAIRLYG